MASTYRVCYTWSQERTPVHGNDMDISCRPCGSIRNRILLFSILVTLVPSMGMGWFWYDITRRTTTDKTAQTLAASAGIIEREMELWFKECSYDLQVFSSAAIVSEHADLLHGGAQTNRSEDRAMSQLKLTTYLNIIIAKFPHYHRLAILDAQGRVLASSGSPEQHSVLALPDTWRQQIMRNRYFVGGHFIPDASGNQRVLVGTSLQPDSDGAPLELMILEADLDPIRALFTSALPRDTCGTGTAITLLDADRNIVFRVTPTPRKATTRGTSAASLPPLNTLALLQEYTGIDHTPVLGIASPISGHPWYQLLEICRDDVYADLLEARNRILMITALLTIAIGGMAIIITRQIIFPLHDLLRAARRVANGDLQTKIPVTRNDELGTVANMFNHMVAQLRTDQVRLQELAATDPLTGLANRKQLMANLDLYMEGFHRHGVCFSLLMLDIDFFKKVNDTYGHQAGDSVLTGVADMLRTMLRKRDTAGRYGGEEFIVVLDTTDLEHGMMTAERIRQAVENQTFIRDDHTLQVTVSIGVGAISNADASVAGLIARVDTALYRAKSEGRNRVCAA